MAGPNLNGVAPSREMFSSFGTDANVFNNTLGNAPLTDLGAIVEGVDKGITLGSRINQYIEENSNDAAESRRLALETARLNQQIATQKLSIQAIELKNKAALEDVELKKKIADSNKSILDATEASKKLAVSNELYNGMSQIQDANSLSEYLSDPKFAIVRSDDSAKSAIRNKISGLLDTASTEDQIKLIRVAESLAPGSGKQLASTLPTATQELIAAPNKGRDPNALTPLQKTKQEQELLVIQDAKSRILSQVKPGENIKNIKTDDAGKDYLVVTSPAGDRQIELTDFAGRDPKTMDLRRIAIKQVLGQEIANTAPKAESTPSSKPGIITPKATPTATTSQPTPSSSPIAMTTPEQLYSKQPPEVKKILDVTSVDYSVKNDSKFIEIATKALNIYNVNNALDEPQRKEIKQLAVEYANAKGLGSTSSVVNKISDTIINGLVEIRRLRKGKELAKERLLVSGNPDFTQTK